MASLTVFYKLCGNIQLLSNKATFSIFGNGTYFDSFNLALRHFANFVETLE